MSEPAPGASLDAPDAASTDGAQVYSPRRGLVETLRTIAADLLSLRIEAPVSYDWFTNDEVASVHKFITAQNGHSSAEIDDQTWRDLAVDELVRVIAHDSSLLGRQLLFHRLRSGSRPEIDPTQEVLQESGQRALLNCRKGRDRLRAIRTNIASPLLHGDSITLPTWSKLVWMIPLLAIGGIGAISYGANLIGWTLIGVYALGAVWAALKLGRASSRWKEVRRGLAEITCVADSWANLGVKHPTQLLSHLSAERAKIRRAVTLLKSSWVERIPLLHDYANLFLFYEYVQLNRRVAEFRSNLSLLQSVYLWVADAECNMAVGEHYIQSSVKCRPEEGRQGSIAFDNLVNPLVNSPKGVSLSICNEGVFLTGRNGSGKSTFLRAVGLSIIMFHSFGYCYSSKASLPRCIVIASITNEDSLKNSESLYMAELRRMEEIWHAVEATEGVVVIADEIFRGTNPAEAVAVSAAVIRHLSTRSTVIVSSHHLILAPLLEPALRSMCISGAADSPRTISPGVLAETNGVEMMRSYGFPEEAKTDAKKVSEWLVDYYVHPKDKPHQLPLI